LGIYRLISIALFALAAPLATAALTTQSDRQMYRVTLAPTTPIVPLRTLHAWTLRLETREGVVFMPTELTIDGGMPGHGHGLPAVPEVTRLLPSGDLLLEGMLFNMAGTWQFRLRIGGPAGFDAATVAFELDAAGTIAGAAQGPDQRPMLRSLSLTALGAVPAEPTNRVADDAAAVAFGRSLFFDPRFSASGSLSCASCHMPDKGFTDGLAQARGEGQTARNTPDLIGVAFRPWLYWDGRRDSLWAQALIPFEASLEMGGSRTRTLKQLTDEADYRARYQALFGALPDLEGIPENAGPLGTPAQIDAWNALPGARRKDLNRAFSNVGKALAAFERRIVPAPGRFDDFVDGKHTLSADEETGMRLFLDDAKTACLRCHNGPLLSNQGFHNIGTGGFEGTQLDFGRVFGLQAVLMDEFNCLGPYSDGSRDDCGQLTHAPRQDVPDRYAGAFKVPGLRNLTLTAPYMHDGRYKTLQEVVEHYRKPPPAALVAGEIRPVDITDEEARQLVAFLESLDGGYRILE
jgi:cytochrome c peroxidase